MNPDEEEWQRRKERAMRTVPSSSGLYHHNYVVRDDSESYVIRVPRGLVGTSVEPRMYDEAAVLAAVGALGLATPRLLYTSDSTGFVAISYLPGRVLSRDSPLGTPLPAGFFEFIGAVLRGLYRISESELGVAVAGCPWSPHGNEQSFMAGLLAWLRAVYDDLAPVEHDFLRAVGLPEDPFAADRWPVSAAGRRLRLCHGDLQRDNVLVADGGRFALLDWELAVWGDPLWDVASLVHRCAPSAEQLPALLDGLLATCPEWTGCAADQAAYSTYLEVERLRSLVLDSARTIRLGREWSGELRFEAAATYRQKLETAGLGSRSTDAILALFERAWAA